MGDVTMAILFYILGWLAILGGAGWAGYLIYNGINALGPNPDIVSYLTSVGILLATPGLWTLFSGLLLLAIGGGLSRLDEIAYNTRT
jgi:hypothetical protein